MHPRTAPTHHRTLTGRLTRCMSVSVLTTGLSLALLTACTAGLGIAAMPANVLTTSVATVPSYELNRRWTWVRRDPSDVWRQVLPFVALSFAGLALSTITVGIADRLAAGAHLTPLLHTGALLTGHLGGFALLWGVQFVVLDRLLFAPRPTTEVRAASGAAS